MSALPVREMVLYKHGVGFFVRAGKVTGETAALTFRQDEINDVLKSLAVFDEAGGQILGIHYQTPMDKEARLANSSIRLTDHASLRDLIRDLRGRKAALNFEITPGSGEMVVGRVIGIDEPGKDQLAANYVLESVSVLVMTEEGQVRVFPLVSLRSITIQDSQSQQDLSYFLDTSMSEDTRRTVNLRLSAGEHDLVVNYVAPSPTWRVSYRVVAESDENAETGKMLLQGWGLFDNRLEEDLEDVRVTLVAGQPISFIYDLYASRIPKRPTVQDESRVAPGPIEFEAAMPAAAEMMLGGFDAAAYDSDEDDRMMGGDALQDHLRKSRMTQSAAHFAAPSRQTVNKLIDKIKPIGVESKESGEFFQYIVTAPVSVKRGESALVPIVGSEVSYQRELLYNGVKLAKHPVAALRFKNSTGLTLERGPVTVVEDGDYKGEAVIAFTKADNEVYLPYAVELGIKVVERSQSRHETVGLKIESAFLIYDQYQIDQVTYTLENTTAKPATILIEASIREKFETFEMPTPEVETLTDRRWKVTLPASTKTEFLLKERMRSSRTQELRNLNYRQLQEFLENRWLDQATFARLSEMLDNFAFIQAVQKERGELNVERNNIYQGQEQLRANLGALQPTGQEAALRNRVLVQLENAQNRLEAIEQRSNEITAQIAVAQTRNEEIMAGLNP